MILIINNERKLKEQINNDDTNIDYNQPAVCQDPEVLNDQLTTFSYYVAQQFKILKNYTQSYDLHKDFI